MNPDQLSANDLAKVAKGVSSLPLSFSEPWVEIIDATHADINMGSFFKKLIIRVSAGIDQWDATKNVAAQLNHTEQKFDMHLKKLIGINLQLMMPGNYARVIFDKENEEVILGLIDDSEQYDILISILDTSFGLCNQFTTL